MAKRYSLLHLSDFHFLQEHWLPEDASQISEADRFLASLVAQFAFRQKSLLDAILISGDLAAVGSRPSLERALSFVESTNNSDYWNGLATLKSSGLRTVLLPGNHDRYRRGLLPGGTAFEDVFSNYWQGDAVRVEYFGKPEGDGLAIIFADFSLESLEPGFLGQGRAHEETVAKLKLLTEKTRKNYAVLWVFHFPPGDNVKRALRLKEWRRVVAAAKRCGVNQLVAGHVHETIFYSLTSGSAQLRIACAGATFLTQRYKLIPARSENSFSLLGIEVKDNQIVEFCATPYVLRDKTYKQDSSQRYSWSV